MNLPKDWLHAEITRLTQTYGTVPPPWVRLPNTHPYDICWRMGAGESHMMVWGEWWHAQQMSFEQQVAYFRQWPPPAAWLHWTADVLWEIHPWDQVEEVDYTPYLTLLAELGFGRVDDPDTL